MATSQTYLSYSPKQGSYSVCTMIMLYKYSSKVYHNDILGFFQFTVMTSNSSSKLLNYSSCSYMFLLREHEDNIYLLILLSFWQLLLTFLMIYVPHQGFQLFSLKLMKYFLSMYFLLISILMILAQILLCFNFND